MEVLNSPLLTSSVTTFFSDYSDSRAGFSSALSRQCTYLSRQLNECYDAAYCADVDQAHETLRRKIDSKLKLKCNASSRLEKLCNTTDRLKEACRDPLAKLKKSIYASYRESELLKAVFKQHMLAVGWRITLVDDDECSSCSSSCQNANQQDPRAKTESAAGVRCQMVAVACNHEYSGVVMSAEQDRSRTVNSVWSLCEQHVSCHTARPDQSQNDQQSAISPQ